jgi:hypothetical protein
MKNYYALFLLLFTVSINYAQQASQTLVVDKAWVSQAEEWGNFEYSGQIVFIIPNNGEEGSLKIGNYDFLYDFSQGRGQFANKATYSTADFTHPVKITTQTNKQGVVNSTYEGLLTFQSEKDYYSVKAIITLLEKNGNILGVKMHLKDSNRKEYAFSLKNS